MIALGKSDQHADAVHALALLRARHERPRRRSVMNSRRFTRSPRRRGQAASGLVNEQNIGTPQRIENRACNDPGILTTDMKPISFGFPSVRVMCLKYGIRN